MFENILPAIKMLDELKDLIEKLRTLHALQAKYAQLLAQAAVAHDIPVAIPAGDPIRLNLALRYLVMVRRVCDFLDGLAKTRQQQGIGPGLLASG